MARPGLHAGAVGLGVLFGRPEAMLPSRNGELAVPVLDAFAVGLGVLFGRPESVLPSRNGLLAGPSLCAVSRSFGSGMYRKLECIIYFV